MDYSISVFKEKVFGKEEKIEPVKDENENKENLYALEKGKTYNIYVSSDQFSDKEYEFTVRQDNWVYAPNGAVRTCKTSLLGDYNRCVYITASDIEEIVQEKVYRTDGVSEPFKVEDYHDLKYVFMMLGLQKTNNDKFREKLGEEATIIGGVIAVLPSSTVYTIIGGTASLVGLVATFSDWDGEQGLEILDFDLCVVYNDQRYSILGADYSVCDHLEAWNTSKYVNKYYNRFRTTIDTNVLPITKAEYCGWL